MELKLKTANCHPLQNCLSPHEAGTSTQVQGSVLLSEEKGEIVFYYYFLLIWGCTVQYMDSPTRGHTRAPGIGKAY